MVNKNNLHKIVHGLPDLRLRVVVNLNNVKSNVYDLLN